MDTLAHTLRNITLIIYLLLLLRNGDLFKHLFTKYTIHVLIKAIKNVAGIVCWFNPLPTHIPLLSATFIKAKEKYTDITEIE